LIGSEALQDKQELDRAKKEARIEIQAVAKIQYPIKAIVINTITTPVSKNACYCHFRPFKAP
jgi:hypothetical protein